MTSQPALFYSASFGELISELEETRDPSMQETHNLAIAKFVSTGDDLLPAILPLIEQIRSETPNEAWPIHPSWNLLNYHACLYYFHIGNMVECRKILDSLWKNAENMDKLILVGAALLTIEIALRNDECTHLEEAETFISSLGDQEAMANFLRTKVSEEEWISRICEQLKFVSLRMEVNKALKMPSEQAKPILEKVLESVEISTDAKNRVVLPVTQVIAIAQAALNLDDQTRYVPILESADNQAHFAVLNNRGIFELLQNRYSSALLHFSKALESRPNTAIVHPYQQIIYNIGISLLMRRKPEKAFQFLHSIVPMMPQSPYLWLRLAECCVMFYKQRVEELRKTTQVSPVVAQQFSTATRTFIVLPQTDYKLFEKYPLQGEGYVRDLNLDFAQKCTRNAIALCSSNKALEPVLRSAELLCSFVSLELGDGRRAAEMGKAVYTASDIDSQRQFYAKIYAAQGHSMMGDVTEATKILSRLLIESSRDLREKEASLVHQITFTRAWLAGQDFKRAQQQIGKVTETDATRPEVALTKVALELANGQPDKALAALHKFTASA